MCHWCWFPDQEKQFQAHHHICCNKPGKKRCSIYASLDNPLEEAKEATIADVKAPEVQYVVKKKMGQKERKATTRAAAAEAGF
jgi:hypothetical protein